MTFASRSLISDRSVKIVGPVIENFTTFVSPANTGGPETVNVPAGVENGDPLIMLVCLINARFDQVVGWTIQEEVRGDGSTNGDVAILSRIADNEPATYDVEYDGTTSGVIWVIRLTNADETRIVTAGTPTPDGSNTATPPFPSVDLPSDSSLLLVAGSVRDNDGVTFVSNMTIEDDDSSGGATHSAVWASAHPAFGGPSIARATDFNDGGGGSVATVAIP